MFTKETTITHKETIHENCYDKIDVYNGTLTMEFDGEIASFKVLDEKGDPHDFRSCNVIGEKGMESC